MVLREYLIIFLSNYPKLSQKHNYFLIKNKIKKKKKEKKKEKKRKKQTNTMTSFSSLNCLRWSFSWSQVSYLNLMLH